MILYNVTVNIDASEHQNWLKWMREEHIPAVMNTGCFIESRISRIQGEEEGGVTFSIMYVSPSQELYDAYLQEHAQELQTEHGLRFNGKFAAFRTVLNVIEEFKNVR